MQRGRSVTVVVIGGGHNGLSMSRQLSTRGVDHVVLERGEVANSWRTQRWDSFTLLTPNWQTRLPGSVYDGDDPDGFMNAGEIASFIADYGEAVSAPLHTGVEVTATSASAGGYEVTTTDGAWRCRCVVLASGGSSVPNIPAIADGVPAPLEHIDPLTYRGPDDLPDGGVLVVGAGATGIQLAEEIHESGRPVTMSVGEHVRMPRTYRGHDIQYWMEAIGRLDERYDEVDEIRRARKVASPQLVGTPDRRTVDLNHLTDLGVALRGRLGMVRDGVALFSGGLRNHCSLADLKLGRLLTEIDGWIDTHDIEAPDDQRPDPTRVDSGAPLTLDLGSGEVAAVVWATGFRPDFSWLDVDVFDADGHLRHDGGVVEAAGIYFLGGSFLRRRRSSFIHGAPADTADLADHLVSYLAVTA